MAQTRKARRLAAERKPGALENARNARRQLAALEREQKAITAAASRVRRGQRRVADQLDELARSVLAQQGLTAVGVEFAQAEKARLCELEDRLREARTLITQLEQERDEALRHGAAAAR